MIYLDNASIEQPKQEVIDAIMSVYQNNWYNSNSVGYDEGLESRRLLIKSKEIIANEVGCKADELVISPSGSAANTCAINGICKKYGLYHFITANDSHTSVLENPYAKPLVRLESDGKYRMDDIEKIHDKFVVLSYASSEIGTIQDIKEIVKILKEHNNMVHIDCVAVLGKVKLNFHELGIDTATITAQKIGGVLGSAMLYVKDGLDLEPLVYGHNGLISGTPNLPAIVGFSKAIELIDWNKVKELRKKRDYLLDKLLDLDGVMLNGSIKDRLYNNINICCSKCELDNQQMIAMLGLLLNGCGLSGGSACNSGEKNPSKTLLALGKNEFQANHSIRITLYESNTYEELDLFYETLKNIVEQYKIN